jgi:hypothetical protein
MARTGLHRAGSSLVLPRITASGTTIQHAGAGLSGPAIRVFLGLVIGGKNCLIRIADTAVFCGPKARDTADTIQAGSEGPAFRVPWAWRPRGDRIPARRPQLGGVGLFLCDDAPQGCRYDLSGVTTIPRPGLPCLLSSGEDRVLRPRCGGRLGRSPAWWSPADRRIPGRHKQQPGVGRAFFVRRGVAPSRHVVVVVDGNPASPAAIQPPPWTARQTAYDAAGAS